jgi:hypothetical protein
MASAIIAGVFTLAGVIVGVWTEPIKAATAHRRDNAKIGPTGVWSCSKPRWSPELGS